MNKEQKYCEITQIEFERLRFELRVPLLARITEADDKYFLDCPMPKMEVWGSNQDAAMDALAFMFSALFKDYALAENKDLSPEAQFIKQQVLFVIKDIQVNDPTNPPARR